MDSSYNPISTRVGAENDIARTRHERRPVRQDEETQVIQALSHVLVFKACTNCCTTPTLAHLSRQRKKGHLLLELSMLRSRFFLSSTQIHP